LAGLSNKIQIFSINQQITGRMVMSFRVAGTFLILAAILFWVSWLLMPGVGITDANKILNLVSQHRLSVAISSGLQLASSAFFAPAMLGIYQFGVAKNTRISFYSSVLMLIGSMGVAADAIFHLLAYEMTHPGTDITQMLPLMRRMQETDLLFIMPMIIAFFVGSIMMAIDAARLQVVSLWNPALYLLAIIVAIVGSQLATRQLIPPRLVGLTVLLLLSTSLAWIGYGLSRQQR
jgi:hypothetical protein